MRGMSLCVGVALQHAEVQSSRFLAGRIPTDVGDCHLLLHYIAAVR